MDSSQITTDATPLDVVTRINFYYETVSISRYTKRQRVLRRNESHDDQRLMNDSSCEEFSDERFL